MEPAITERAFPRKEPPARSTLGFGDYDTVMNVLAKGAGAADPYLMGKQFTAADVIIGSGLRWGMMFKLIPDRPEFTAYVGRLSERPALKRATEKDAKLQKEQEGAASNRPPGAAPAHRDKAPSLLPLCPPGTPDRREAAQVLAANLIP